MVFTDLHRERQMMEELRKESSLGTAAVGGLGALAKGGVKAVETAGNVAHKTLGWKGMLAGAAGVTAVPAMGAAVAKSYDANNAARTGGF